MRLITAGESHGRALVGVIEGLPAGITVSEERINADLARRQEGYGRGGRMKIETDKVEVLSGMIGGKTIASPLAFTIKNRDYENWIPYMDPFTGEVDKKALTAVRPGHADLSGIIKYGFGPNARPVLERASARETTTRVAAGSVCRQALEAIGVTITGRTLVIGGVGDESKWHDTIRAARLDGDTLGGCVEITVHGMPVGVGSYVQYDRKLDAALAMHMMSINAVKAVEVGLGREFGYLRGSEAHDEIFPDGRKTNRAGGIEGGMSNGEDIVLTLTFKPIPTLVRGLRTVDVKTGEPVTAANERSDVCVVESAAVVVAESVAAYAVLDEILKTFGGDTLDELKSRVEERRAHARR